MVYLRKATMQDMDLIYKWANDPAVRNNSFNSDFIPYETHVKWFNRIMTDDSVRQFIMMDDDSNVGQIRIQIIEDSAEIGYSIAPEYRGKGYGHKILHLLADEMKRNYPNVKKLIAKVKPENIASNKLFDKEGYTLEYHSYSLEL